MSRGRRPFTITQRVVWAVTGTVALLVGLQTVLACFAMHVQEDELTDVMLHREVRHLLGLAQRPGLMPAGALVASPRVQAWLSRGGEGASDVPADVRRLVPGLHQLEPPGQVLHVAVVDTEDGRLSVVLDATESESRVHCFGLTLLALWLVCVTATAFIARGVAAIRGRPDRRGDAQHRPLVAREIGRRRLAARRGEHPHGSVQPLPRPRRRDGGARARVRRQPRSRDPHAAHRHPHRCRADRPGGAARPEQQQRVERIVASDDEIIATTASTLSSSAGRVVDAEPIDLREVVRTACDAMDDRAASCALRIAIDVVGGESLAADRQALLTICRNIVKNAVEHAAPAQLTIEGDRHRLTFRDDGPGIDAAALPHVFERYHEGHRSDAEPASGVPRRGLGLAIARRLCDMQGWRLGVRSPAPGGARGVAFTLEFDAAA